MVNKEIGFSLWCDFVERKFLKDDFKKLIDDGIINGATSNPAIFQSAFKSDAYKEDVVALKGKNKKEIYEALAIKDIQQAADHLKPLYDAGNDGFISIEVDPFLCDDAIGTYEEGKRLHETIGRENVMIKVPVTEAGYEAIEKLVAEGIHVNCTLIFSPGQIKCCLDAIKAGYDKKPQNKAPKTVLSVFVSRFDRKCDKVLEEKGMEPGRLGIINAEYCYTLSEESGVPNCRTLFASTGVKGDSYPPSYYVDELLFSNCVNTAPLGTIEAYVKEGSHTPKKAKSKDECEAYFQTLTNAGINLDSIYQELIDEGLVAFKNSFTELLNNLEG